MDHKTLENQIFTWKKWDENGPSDMQFYDVELLVQVGEFPAGTKFPTAFFMGSSSILALFDEKENEHAYELRLGVGEKINPHGDADACGCGVLH